MTALYLPSICLTILSTLLTTILTQSPSTQTITLQGKQQEMSLETPIYSIFRSSHSVMPATKKTQKIGPKTLNPKFVNPYSKVPIRLSSNEMTKKTEMIPPPMRLLHEDQARNLHMQSGNNSTGSSGSDQNGGDFKFRNSAIVSGEYDEDIYSNEDYVDMTSDDPEDDEQSVDEQYKRLTDIAMQQSTFSNPS